MMQNKPFVIGLTGNSGCGKGEVGKILADNGALVIDCDVLAHENMAKGGPAYSGITDAFGSGILLHNGEIDRKKLGAIVFADNAKLELLNKITHKHITARIKQIIEQNSGCGIIVIDAPLLKQAGLMPMCSSIWLVKASVDTRLRRVMHRDGITREQALARFKNQQPFDEALADVIIENELDDTRGLAADVLDKLLAVRGAVK